MKAILKLTLLIFIISTVGYYGIYFIDKYRPHNLGTMQPGLVILSALAIAFVYVYYLNPFKHVKPFNCVTCLTGWVALMLSYCFNVPFYLVYFPIGVLIGGLFERLKMRYL